MADSTLQHYSDLAGCLIVGEHPILPKPEWGQDAAFVAFTIDGLKNRLAEVTAAAEALLLAFYPPDNPGSTRVSLTVGWPAAVALKKVLDGKES